VESGAARINRPPYLPDTEHLTLTPYLTLPPSGLLNLIDLAGSERLSRSGVTGERLKETQVRQRVGPLIFSPSLWCSVGVVC
jgi:hypothetical protein